jgi:phosphomannomutase
MSEPSDAVVAAAQAWLDQDPDSVTRAELADWIERRDPVLSERFSGRLQFGTAGLRGPIGAGPMAMNRVTVIRAAAGLAHYLIDTVPDARSSGVVIGCDARHNSSVFAQDSARVLAAAGLRVHLLPDRWPTPLLAFAVRHLGTSAGVMVTASHNPPGDNGYKVYLGDGAQIVPPQDAEIAAHIDAVGPLSSVPLADLNDPRIIVHGEEVRAAYLGAIGGLLFDATARELSIAYTPLHGVGLETARLAFAAAGFPPPLVVVDQADPDPDFPTVPFPNPEEPGAMDRLLALAATSGADLAVANDPDADRLAAAVAVDGQWRALSGNELGWLLADHVLRHTSGRRLVATTIVSSTLLRSMAADHGVAYAETLTGFKWIARAIAEHPDEQFVFGYEQALGYLVGDVVRDKDGISAALLLAEAAAIAKREGSSLTARLDELATRYGRHRTVERSVPMSPAEQQAAMARLRADQPSDLAGHRVVEVVDRPDGNVLAFSLGGGARVLVRPSGTEPKVKVYGEAVDADPSALVEALIARLG